MEFPEFHHLIELLYYYNELSNLFGQLDTNKDKRISYSEFKKGHQLIGRTDLDDYQLKEEFHQIDTNHGGYILFDEVKYEINPFLPSSISFSVLYLHGKEEITSLNTIYTNAFDVVYS